MLVHRGRERKSAATAASVVVTRNVSLPFRFLHFFSAALYPNTDHLLAFPPRLASLVIYFNDFTEKDKLLRSRCNMSEMKRRGDGDERTTRRRILLRRKSDCFFPMLLLTVPIRVTAIHMIASVNHLLIHSLMPHRLVNSCCHCTSLHNQS
jgi:hypothetical protein